MTLHLLSLDFRRAPLALREKVAFADPSLPDALAALREAGASEAAILSTCNRVELLAEFPPSHDAPHRLLKFLGAWHAVSPDELAPACCLLHAEEAARHLVRVACGLESLVPGEMQILGQVRQAAAHAREAAMLGPELTALFDVAQAAGRRARRETGIARRPVSVSHVAVNLIQHHFGKTLQGRRVLLIGSGKMGELAARQLHKAGAAHLIVANRTLERACQLAQRWDGSALQIEQLPEALLEVDAVIAATGAPHLILHAPDMAAVMARRGGRELLLIDLAVPRDIDPAVRAIAGVTLCDVDGLQTAVADNIALRNGEREQVEGIVQEEVARWQARQAVRTVAPTIVRLRQAAEQIRQAELDKALSRLGHLSDQERAIVEALSRGLMNKLLHEPTVRLRAHAADADGPHFRATVEELFALSGQGSHHD